MTTVGTIEQEEEGWQTVIKKFLVVKEMLEDKKEVMRIRIKAARYVMMGGKLYRKSYDNPML